MTDGMFTNGIYRNVRDLVPGNGDPEATLKAEKRNGWPRRREVGYAHTNGDPGDNTTPEE